MGKAFFPTLCFSENTTRGQARNCSLHLPEANETASRERDIFNTIFNIAKAVRICKHSTKALSSRHGTTFWREGYQGIAQGSQPRLSWAGCPHRAGLSRSLKALVRPGPPYHCLRAGEPEAQPAHSPRCASPRAPRAGPGSESLACSAGTRLAGGGAPTLCVLASLRRWRGRRMER